MMIKTMQTIMTFLPMLLTVAFLTLMERKMLATSQMRKGPNIVGFYGLLQPMADAMKLMMKEANKPNKTNSLLFTLSPMMSMSMALTTWSLIPLHNKSPQSDTSMSMIMMLALSSLSVYTILLTGWASNSKYSLLGSMRATAQMMSYEMSIGLMMLCVMYLSSSLSLSTITESQMNIWFLMPLFPAFTMLLMSSLAETNRTPFDLTESESELVSGFNVEYSATLFTLLFLAEYTNILLMSAILSMLFLGSTTMNNTSTPMMLATKMLTITYMFMWARATYPRTRYDQLMHLVWKSYLPMSLSLTMLIPSIMIFFHCSP
uniref:NADH-ubiquinone oxidoreductase chain 1 n=1 Tax=Oopsacas minuta TaxID=111878 RepID=A0A0G3ZCB4_9METZ|nr:NADH dehydrogenase subunit 1 [Oopsacas minuta]AKM54878.1 NADH dehydrogenase subunit 1 [Oopsacas minuta]